jgi:hypothetical protein
MKKQVQRLGNLLHQPSTRLLVRLGIAIGFCALSQMVLADDGGTDLLAGTTADALSTIKGAGRNWAYIVDGAISLGAFAKTKNPFVFASVLAVALGVTVICKMAGG